MEHSYSRDCRPLEGCSGLTTRTLLVHRPPQCPSCHSHPLDEGIDSDDANHPPIPTYNESAAIESMNECTRIANSVRNLNSDDQDWEENINKSDWTSAQEKLFKRVARILDLDHLARLTTMGRQQEPVHRRVIIDKSVQRMRQALASVSWEPRLTQWLHGLLMDNLPPSYMASYLDILQTLKTRLPTLMDKMLFGKPMNINQDLLTPVMKKQWDLIISQKIRKLPGNSIIVIVPSIPTSSGMAPRLQKWYQLLATMAPIAQITIPGGGSSLNKQPIDQVAEHLVSLTRTKIQDLRSEQPSRHIILVGYNGSAALALQVALLENVNSIVCLGFSYNTINGVRGAPDDHILELTTPVLFVIGQNSARTSQEEMESLRERMQAETSLVVVGSADDVLRVSKSKRQIESVTQAMIDNMITDEIYEFVKNCILNPPGPRQPVLNIAHTVSHSAIAQPRKIGASSQMIGNIIARKRKLSQGSNPDALTSSKSKAINNRITIGRPRVRPLQPPNKQQFLSQPSTEVLNMAIQSILPEQEKSSALKQDENDNENQILSSYEIITQPKIDARNNQNIGQAVINSNTSSVTVPIIQRSNIPTTQKIKMIPSNQFVQIKPSAHANTQKIYTIKTSPLVTNSNQAGGDSLRSQGPILTVKTATPSQFIPVSSSQNQIVLNPQKFTVIKPATNISSTNIISNVNENVAPKSSDLSPTNIFDMPIIFADSEGNIQDTTPVTLSNQTQPATTTSSAAPQILITQSQQNSDPSSVNKSFVLSSAIQKSKPNKVVFINRNTMKPCTSIISKNIPPLKYTKVVLANPKTSTASIVARTPGSNDSDKPITTITIQKPKTIELPPGTIVKTANPLTTQSGIINNMQTTGTKQFQPIIINVDSDKNSIKNMIKVGDQQIKPTILLKPGSFKSIPVLKSGILNRNVTVKKIVNLVQTKNGIASITQIPTTTLSTENINTSSIITSNATQVVTPASDVDKN